MNNSFAQCFGTQYSPMCFDGTQLAQKALSAIVRTNQQLSIYMLISHLRGYANEEMQQRGLNQLPTFGIGREISYDDWQDYLSQMRRQGLIEVDYRYSKNVRISAEGQEVLYGRKRTSLEVISRVEDYVLFDKLCRLRQQQAQAANEAAPMIFSDEILHKLALRKPKTLNAFKYISAASDEKLALYGQAYVATIRDHTNPNNKLTINGHTHEIPLSIWNCMAWREVITRVRKIHYWNFYEPKSIPLSEVITSPIEPKEKVQEVMMLFGKIILEEFHAECYDQMLIVPKRIEFDCDANPVESLKCETFEEGLRMFQAFVDENQHYPFSGGSAYECSLRRWYQEVGHGYIVTTEEQKRAFDQLDTIYAHVARNRATWEKIEALRNNSTVGTLK